MISLVREMGHDGIWVIVDRLTKSAHFLTGWKELYIGAFGQAVC